MKISVLYFVYYIVQHPPLPGGQEDIAMETLYAEPDCTMAWKEPLNIIQVQHHSHFMGLKQVC